jgi:archaellum component FlaC
LLKGDAKSTPSKFDQIRSKISATEESDGISNPTRAVSASREVQRLGQAGVARAADPPVSIAGISEHLSVNRNRLNELNKRVASTSKSKFIEPLRNRLTAIEDEYKQIDAAVKNMSSQEDPQKLLQLQQSVYRMSENVVAISKIADQVTAGVKSILQTQV